MAKITDELREWAKTFWGCDGKSRYAMDLLAIADRIDEVYKSALASAYNNGVESVTLPDMTAYVKLPVDAEGEVWHVGDFAVGEVNPRNPKAIERMIWYGPDSGWQLETNTIIYLCPDRPRHHHAPTVEDVLWEFVSEFNRDDTELCDEEIIERFAKKLRLAGDE